MLDKIKGKNLKLIKAVFYMHLAYVFYLVFFSSLEGREAIFQYGFDSANLVPFNTISHYLRVRGLVPASVLLANLAGNIILFMPFGMLLPLVHPATAKWWKVLLVSLLLSLFIESVQLVAAVGIFDVDDLILNTCGGLLGYLIGGAIWKRGS